MSWKFENSGMTDCVYSKDSCGADVRICELIGPDSRKHGVLIASAPDLLETLQAAVLRVELANKEGNPILSAWLPDAKAAIAAATQA